MSDVLDGVLTDLAAEGDRLESPRLRPGRGRLADPHPGAGWDVATQVAHLVWTDEVAVLAAPPTRRPGTHVVLQALADPEQVRRRRGGSPRLAPRALLARWRAAREALAEALRAYPAGQKMPWFGPPMSPTSMATARFMETWAHGSTSTRRSASRPSPPTGSVTSPPRGPHPRLRVRRAGLDGAGRGVRVELTAPSGDTWAWGPEDAAQTVTGSAYDFGLLVTQRVHRTDTDLVATGEEADRWLDIAQAFAGPPGEGRAALASDQVGNCSGFYGDRLTAMREMLEGGDAGRPHRRLPRRADHADPRQGPDEGPVARATPARSSASSRTASASRSRTGEDRHQRRRAQPGRSGRPAARGRDRASGCRPGDRARRGRRPPRRRIGLPEGALTANAYLGGFGIAAALARRRRRRRHRPGHRRLARGRPGSGALRLDPDVVRRAGRRRGRRPRHRVRYPGDGRQLLGFPTVERVAAARLPARGGRGRRLR